MSKRIFSLSVITLFIAMTGQGQKPKPAVVDLMSYGRLAIGVDSFQFVAVHRPDTLIADIGKNELRITVDYQRHYHDAPAEKIKDTSFLFNSPLVDKWDELASRSAFFNISESDQYGYDASFYYFSLDIASQKQFVEIKLDYIYAKDLEPLLNYLWEGYFNRPPGKEVFEAIKSAIKL